MARSKPADSIPWLMDADKSLVVFVKPDGKKSAMPLADVMCSVVRERGVTEFNIVDHTAAPLLKDLIMFQMFLSAKSLL